MNMIDDEQLSDSIDESELLNEDKSNMEIENEGLSEISEEKCDDLSEEKEVSSEDRIKALELELLDSKDKTLRALADSENTRRQMEKNRQDSSKYGVQPLAREILSVLDNFSRAIKADENEEGNDKVSLKKGVELTLKELKGIIEKFNIKKIEPLGKPFDPNLHQAMFEGESKDYETGLVCQVIQEGYMFHDRLLRPAMVGISKNIAIDKEKNET